MIMGVQVVLTQVVFRRISFPGLAFNLLSFFATLVTVVVYSIEEVAFWNQHPNFNDWYKCELVNEVFQQLFTKYLLLQWLWTRLQIISESFDYIYDGSSGVWQFFFNVCAVIINSFVGLVVVVRILVVLFGFLGLGWPFIWLFFPFAFALKAALSVYNLCCKCLHPPSSDPDIPVTAERLHIWLANAPPGLNPERELQAARNLLHSNSMIQTMNPERDLEAQAAPSERSELMSTLLPTHVRNYRDIESYQRERTSTFALQNSKGAQNGQGSERLATIMEMVAFTALATQHELLESRKRLMNVLYRSMFSYVPMLYCTIAGFYYLYGHRDTYVTALNLHSERRMTMVEFYDANLSAAGNILRYLMI